MQKLYVQYIPDPDSRARLQEIQTLFTTGRHVPIGQLHVTVLHFGFIDEAFAQLKNCNPDIDRADFNRELTVFIDRLRPDLPKQCELTICGIDRFGPSGGTVALVLDKNIALLQAHNHAMECLRMFINNLGINSLADIPSRPRALQISTTLTPHVSLVKSVRESPDLESIAKPYIGTALKMSLDLL